LVAGLRGIVKHPALAAIYLYQDLFVRRNSWYGQQEESKLLDVSSRNSSAHDISAFESVCGRPARNGERVTDFAVDPAKWLADPGTFVGPCGVLGSNRLP
jgi:hypothetical protein